MPREPEGPLTHKVAMLGGVAGRTLPCWGAWLAVLKQF